jgi:hypothetical protein
MPLFIVWPLLSGLMMMRRFASDGATRPEKRGARTNCRPTYEAALRVFRRLARLSLVGGRELDILEISRSRPHIR